jgi:hypothetical protein
VNSRENKKIIDKNYPTRHENNFQKKLKDLLEKGGNNTLGKTLD